MNSEKNIKELLEDREVLLQYRRNILAQISALKGIFELTGEELVELDSKIEINNKYEYE